MLNFQLPLPDLTFDQVNLTKTMDRIIGQVLRESTREWLRVLLSDVNVPVETGMARATLIPIGEYLHNVGGLIFAPTRNPYFHATEGTIASIESGIDRQQFQIVDTAIGSWVYSVQWDPHVKHYWVEGYYENVGNTSTPGPEALDKAEEAFFGHFYPTLDRRFPPLEGYIS